MVNFTIYAGGFVSFVASFLFNPDVPSLTLLHKNPTGNHPGWITSNPTDNSILYAVNAVVDGRLQSYRIESGGILNGPVDDVSSGGDDPAYAAALSSGQVAVMNYNAGTGTILETTNGGLNFKTAPVITFPVPASGKSHPHMAYQYKDEVFVPDLGADTIHRLIQDKSTRHWAIHGSINQPTGSGPRHIAIYKDILYTVHELSSTLTSQKIPALPANSSVLISNVFVPPPNPPSGAVWAGAEILIPPTSHSFPNHYIYVSNRNTGVQDPKGDTIAIFSFDPNTGVVTLENHVYTGLDQVRGMEFGGEDSKYLVAGGVAGTGGVVVFERVSGGKDMKEIVRNRLIPNATTFAWTK